MFRCGSIRDFLHNIKSSLGETIPELIVTTFPQGSDVEIMNSATASDSCELTLECSSLEQEELQVLHVGPGGGGKLSSHFFFWGQGYHP